MSKPLDGKVALVTGGSRGIGAATARALADQGAHVAISYARSADQANQLVNEIETKGLRGLAVQADAADVASQEALVDTVMGHFGRLDIVVNNAGTFSIGELGQLDLAEFDRVFAINVRAPFVLSNKAAQVLADNGRIINIGSVNADRLPLPGLGVYGASKAAIKAFSQGLDPRSGRPGDYRQYRPAWPGRYRHEPVIGRFRAGSEAGHGARPLCPARGNCCFGGLPGRSGSAEHPGHDQGAQAGDDHDANQIEPHAGARHLRYADQT